MKPKQTGGPMGRVGSAAGVSPTKQKGKVTPAKAAPAKGKTMTVTRIKT